MRHARLAGVPAALLLLLLLVLVVAPSAQATLPPPHVETVPIARDLLGTPYLDGGVTPAGFDAGGLLVYVYAQAGVTLPQAPADLVLRGVALQRTQLRAGDIIVYYKNGVPWHAGLYVGDRMMIHASHSDGVVETSPVHFWQVGAMRRITGPTFGRRAVAIAQQYLGVPYVFGGASPKGFDCSGLTMYVYAQLGVALAHGATDQQKATTPVPLNSLRPGDLVFFGSADYSYHVGIYVGSDTMIHAPHTGAVVSYGPIDGAWIGGRVAKP